MTTPDTRRSPLAALTGAVAFLLPVAYSNGLGAPFFSLRGALLLLVAAIGLPLAAVRVLRDRSPVHAAGVALVVVAGLATALSANPVFSLFGPYGAGSGLLFVAGLVGAASLGDAAGASARGATTTALLAAAALNSVVALAQPFGLLEPLGLGLVESRSHGLTGNPVHLGTLLVGALALAALRSEERRPFVLLIPLLVAGASASGSRFALGLLALMAGIWVVRRRNRLAIAVLALGLVGYVGGEAALRLGGGAATIERLDSVGVADTSTVARLYTWREAGDAFLQRPLLGHGPGRYLEATSPVRDIRLARALPDSYFRDAHNIAVQFAVTTGALGALLLLAWVGLLIARARGPLLWFALGLLAMHLVQPMFPATTPLLFLALGSAGSTRPLTLGRAPAVGIAALGLVGLIAGVALVAGDLRFRQGFDAYSPDTVRRADALLPPWPEVADVIATMYAFEGTTTAPGRLDDAARWQHEAARRNPGDPRWWNRLGLLELRRGRPDLARAAFDRALETNPYSRRAMLGMLRVSLQENDCKAAREWVDELAFVAPDSKAERNRIEEHELGRCRGQAG